MSKIRDNEEPSSIQEAWQAWKVYRKAVDEAGKVYVEAKEQARTVCGIATAQALRTYEETMRVHKQKEAKDGP